MGVVSCEAGSCEAIRSSVDPADEYGVGSLSQLVVGAGYFAGDGSDRAGIDEVGFFEHDRGAFEEIRDRPGWVDGSVGDHFEQLPVRGPQRTCHRRSKRRSCAAARPASAPPHERLRWLISTGKMALCPYDR